MRKPKILVSMGRGDFDLFYPQHMQDALASIADPVYALTEERPSQDEFIAQLQGCEALFSWWGTPKLTKEVLAAAPDLRLVCHAGGSVRHLMPEPPSEFYRRGLQISSATPVMSPYVAEHTLALAVAVLRRLSLFRDRMKDSSYWGYQDSAPYLPDTIIGQKVGLVGLGMISWEFVRMIKPYQCELYAFSTHGDPTRAGQEGITLVELDELLSTCPIICLFAAVRPDTIGMIDKRRLKLIKDGSVLINTARGKLIDEEALVEELKTGRIWAGIDVTDPEPPAVDSPLRTLPNVMLSPHVAGPTPTRYWEFVQYAIEDLRRYLAGKPLLGAVTEERLERMA